MSDSERAELARRLFGSVRRQRPSAELEARILAAGRAELEPGRGLSALDAQRRLEQAPAALGSARRARARAIEARRWVAVGALAVAAAGLFVYLGPGRASERGVLISAEHAGTPALPSDARERALATHPPASRPQRAEREADAPGSVEPDTANEPTAPAREAAASTSEAPSRDVTPASRRNGVKSERAAPLGANPDATSSAVPQPAATTRALPAPARSERTPALPETPRASLGQQLEQIKEARAALRAGDHRRALELLEAYRARPAGAEMAAEASLLRIEALAASGQREAAAQAARQFASDFPNSPLIDRALSYAASRAER
jgi:hypothetical protein